MRKKHELEEGKLRGRKGRSQRARSSEHLLGDFDAAHIQNWRSLFKQVQMSQGPVEKWQSEECKTLDNITEECRSSLQKGHEECRSERRADSSSPILPCRYSKDKGAKRIYKR